MTLSTRLPVTSGSCMTCKTANLRDIYRDMGWNYAKTALPDLLSRITHPIVCANCHDPKNMKLRVINPAFIEAMTKRGVDIAKASREDMRSYVCGQCHAGRWAQIFIALGNESYETRPGLMPYLSYAGREVASGAGQNYTRPCFSTATNGRPDDSKGS